MTSNPTTNDTGKSSPDEASPDAFKRRRIANSSDCMLAATCPDDELTVPGPQFRPLCGGAFCFTAVHPAWGGGHIFFKRSGKDSNWKLVTDDRMIELLTTGVPVTSTAVPSGGVGGTFASNALLRARDVELDAGASEGDEPLAFVAGEVSANQHEWLRKSIIDNDGLTSEAMSALDNAFGADSSDGTGRVNLSDCTKDDFWTKEFITGKSEYVPKLLATKAKAVETPERKKSKRGGGRKYERTASLLVMVDSLFAGYRFYEGNGTTSRPFVYNSNWKEIAKKIHKKLWQKFCQND